MVRIPARDYWNIAGRAGRAGAETQGTVIHIVLSNLDAADYQHYLQARGSVEEVESPLLKVLRWLADRRLTTAEAMEALNSEILALMVEEDPDALDESIRSVLQNSLVAQQAARLHLDLDPVVGVFTDGARKIQNEVASSPRLRAYRDTGLCQASCDALWSALLEREAEFRILLTDAPQSSLPRLMELIGNTLGAVTEAGTELELPIDRWELALRWLDGMTIADLGNEFGLEPEALPALGVYVTTFFVQSLPWITAAFERLACEALHIEPASLSPWVRTLPTMLRFGLPTPEAAWAMSLGVSSRRSAAQLAERFRATESTGRSFRGWFASLEYADLQSVGLSGDELLGAIRASDRIGGVSLEDTLPIATRIVVSPSALSSQVAAAVRSGDRLGLVRDFDNTFDRNAIAVLTAEGSFGYVPRQVARLLGPEIDATGARYEAVVIEVATSPVAITVEIELERAGA